MKKRALILTLTLAVAAFAGACRSRVKPSTAPPPPAPVVESAPATTVDAPERDFVQPMSDEDRIVAGDLEQLNRVARERGWIADAFFHYDSSALSDDARRALQSSARWLASRPEISVTIEGHCDERGTQQYNLALGDNRANVAADYLAALGIGRDRISTVSYGEDRPFEEGSSDASWRLNRRAHLVLRR